MEIKNSEGTINTQNRLIYVSVGIESATLASQPALKLNAKRFIEHYVLKL